MTIAFDFYGFLLDTLVFYVLASLFLIALLRHDVTRVYQAPRITRALRPTRDTEEPSTRDMARKAA